MIYDAEITNLPNKSILQGDSVLIFIYNGTYWLLTGTDYDSVIQTFSSATNLDVPLIGGNDSASLTATWTTYTNTFKNLYGAIPNNDALRAKINLSTGLITVPGGIYASTGTFTGTLNIKGLVGTSAVDYGSTLPTNPTEGRVFFQISNPVYELPAGGTTGQALIKNSGTDRDVIWGSVGGIMSPSADKYYVSGSSTTATNSNPSLFNTNVYVENNVLFGAAWNDYAEYRHTIFPVAPGRCVVEDGHDNLILSNKRLQPGAEIISDTFGFAIGQTQKCNTPIAVTGRVLAYPYEPIEEFLPGRPVCSGPNGTVSIMTEDEARNYPWLIIGTVSAIPSEETWGANNISTKDRIWIRVR